MPVKRDLMDVNLVDKVRFVIDKNIVFNKPIIIEGFQGVGLVGTLSAQYLAQKNGFEKIGYVDSEGLPPMALLVNGDIRHPVKVFANKSRDIIIIESELAIPRKIIYELSEEIVKWAKGIKSREIICLEGISVPDENRDYELFGMSTNDSVIKSLIKSGVKKLENGIVIGMSAALLLKAMEYKIPATCLMVESRPNFPDGLAAAAMLDVLSKNYGFKIDVTDLKRQANDFEKKIQKVLTHAQQFKNLEDGVTKRTSIYG